MSSFISYNGHGFWCSDGAAALLAALISERLKTVSAEPWVSQQANALHQLAESYFPGSMTLYMDRYLVSEERREVFEQAILAVMHELTGSLSIPLERERALPHAKHFVISAPTQTDWMLRYTSVILLMLRGLWDKDETFELR